MKKKKIHERAYNLIVKHGGVKRAAKAEGLDDKTLAIHGALFKPDSPYFNRPKKYDKYEILAIYNELQDVGATARKMGIKDNRLVRYYLALCGVDAETPGDAGAEIGKNNALSEEVKIAVDPRSPEKMPLPERGVFRYILTCAQNNTPLYSECWENILALAEYLDARIMVSRFSYNKQFTLARKPGTRKASDGDEVWYDARIGPYTFDKPAELAPNLIWCGEMNILPTAVRPLSGLATYTKEASSVIPHVKIAMESHGVMNGRPPKISYTTGTITQRNYIQKKAGLKADFHHCYGALLVEVDSKGRWWTRQLNADNSGTIYDLNIKVEGGKVHENIPIKAVVWGDVHHARLNEDIERASWMNPDSLLKTLKPKYQILHDVLDFKARNHHDRGNPHINYKLHLADDDNVEREVYLACRWIRYVEGLAEPWEGQVAVVASNHNDAYLRWLKEADYRSDPKNAIFFLASQLAYYQSIRDGESVHPLTHAYNSFISKPSNVKFVKQDESYRIDGVEHGIHGHIGVNGTRGNKNTFLVMGDKMTIGHSHHAGIVDGVYQVGTSSNLRLGYNTGPSSWTNSHVIQYNNGKRAVITLRDNKWRA